MGRSNAIRNHAQQSILMDVYHAQSHMFSRMFHIQCSLGQKCIFARTRTLCWALQWPEIIERKNSSQCSSSDCAARMKLVRNFCCARWCWPFLVVHFCRILFLSNITRARNFHVAKSYLRVCPFRSSTRDSSPTTWVRGDNWTICA